MKTLNLSLLNINMVYSVDVKQGEAILVLNLEVSNIIPARKEVALFEQRNTDKAA